MLVELLSAFIEGSLAEPVDGAQRGAQIVGDRITETLQLLIRPLQFFGPVVTQVCQVEVSANRASSSGAENGLVR